MLKFCSLYSGSSGNSLFVQSNNTKILIDCGTSAKKIETALDNIDIDITDIDAILVTHEHSDHIQGLGTISKKHDIPVFANCETWEAMENQRNKMTSNNIKTFENNTEFHIGNLQIVPFSTPHDAVNPCGFSICSGTKKISIATDLGHIDENIFSNIKDSKFMLLEANYEPEILKVSNYPYGLKQRIAGPHGHLSNIEAGKTISNLFGKELKEVMLGHLSKENNFPEMAYKTVTEELIHNNIDTNDIRISVASRFNPSKIITI
ncbi:MAG: MBL fold metallo-hydrolase [Clostridia bacterium]|nr:MBL fold metallo-hydrolase [Clostridia bacterium]